MTAILLAACLVLAALLLCALVGGSAIRDELRDEIDWRDTQIEDLTNEVRWHQRRRHPAGRALSETPVFEELAVAALREAMEARDAGHEGGAS